LAWLVGVGSLLLSLLLVAGEEQDFVRLLVGQVAHIAALAGVVHQGLHAQDVQRLHRQLVLGGVGQALAPVDVVLALTGRELAAGLGGEYVIARGAQRQAVYH